MCTFLSDTYIVYPLQIMPLYEHQTHITHWLLATQCNAANFANVVKLHRLANRKPTALDNIKFT